MKGIDGNYKNLLNKRKDILEGDDADRLEKICDHVRGKWSVAPELKYYTLHDHRHSERVEWQLYELLPDKDFKKLKPEERFLLLASAWLHDIGMIRDLFGDKDKKLTEIEVRETHQDRSERYINSKDIWPVLGLRPEETTPLGIICQYHRKTEDLRKCNEEIPVPGVGQIRTRLLAAYLRLADALRIADLSGVPEKEFRTNMIMGMGPESTFHWLKSKYAQGTSVAKEPFTITISLKNPIGSAEDIAPLGKFLCDEIQEELDSSMDTLIRGRLSLYLRVEYKIIEDAPLRPDEMEGLRWALSHIETMFSTSAGMAINSVLKNIQVILNLDNERVIEELLNYKRIILVPFLEEKPCHAYLTKIKKMLEENLKNIPDPNKLDATNRDQIIISIREKINQWQRERERAFEAFSDMSKPFFIDGSPILLYGYSSSVVKAIESLPDKKSTEVYICECKTKNRYGYNNRLRYCDGIHYASEIRKAGFKEIQIHLVTDSCASNLFSKGKISKVLFGANGIGENGEISHGLGHLAMADMAKEYNIPVYVIAETTKIIKEIKKNPDLPRKVEWLTTDLSVNFDDFKQYNPREDIVPPEKITMLITEKGAFQPRSVKQMCKMHDIDINC
ncbi:MAG: Putative methylthioribose-1-phosphate isomerase [Candidatus Argoarchaeum ethanivorans]|uniref:Methylthioribose-1-phosphate isomerase n=1 Tax=Candidatus Argoarchaeum ethanivorans TaxID=2608793 RepID=A0A811TB84_9EURY|nr:MAG: Putative methylthioribose-1-phosphate isomerase [Candidatus Argoarchaeum ethanivorans]